MNIFVVMLEDPFASHFIGVYATLEAAQRYVELQDREEIDGEQYTMRYEVINGVIASSERVIADSIKLEITYGTTETELALLTDAVNEYLESE